MRENLFLDGSFLHARALCRSKGVLSLVNHEISKGKDNRGGPRPNSGRKSKAEEFGLAALLDECWKPADRKAVILSLSKQAKEGNEKAAALLLAYAYGKPHETIQATITHREFEVEIGGDPATNSEPEFVN